MTDTTRNISTASPPPLTTECLRKDTRALSVLLNKDDQNGFLRFFRSLKETYAMSFEAIMHKVAKSDLDFAEKMVWAKAVMHLPSSIRRDLTPFVFSILDEGEKNGMPLSHDAIIVRLEALTAVEEYPLVQERKAPKSAAISFLKGFAGNEDVAKRPHFHNAAAKACCVAAYNYYIVTGRVNQQLIELGLHHVEKGQSLFDEMVGRRLSSQDMVKEPVSSLQKKVTSFDFWKVYLLAMRGDVPAARELLADSLHTIDIDKAYQPARWRKLALALAPRRCYEHTGFGNIPLASVLSMHIMKTAGDAVVFAGLPPYLQGLARLVSETDAREPVRRVASYRPGVAGRDVHGKRRWTVIADVPFYGTSPNERHDLG